MDFPADPTVRSTLQVAYFDLNTTVRFRLTGTQVEEHGCLGPAWQFEVGDRVGEVLLGSSYTFEDLLQTGGERERPRVPRHDGEAHTLRSLVQCRKH